MPRRLAVTNATPTRLTLSWRRSSDNVKVAGYEVYRTRRTKSRTTRTTHTMRSFRCGTTYRIGVAAFDRAGNRSRKAWINASTAACAPPPLPPPPPPPPPQPPQPPPPPPPPPLGQPQLEAVDGGPDYYAQFSNPLSSAPTFFPIAVWGSYAHEVANVAEDKAVGINTYVWVADPSVGFMNNIRNAGQRVIQARERQENHGAETAGWVLADEIDMTQGPSACPGTLNSYKTSISSPGGRFYYDNYGKGVIFWQTDAQAACFVNYDDVNSVDIYWFTDSNVCTSRSEGPRFYGLESVRALTQAECRRARNYGDVVEDMRRLDALNGSPRHPIWNFVEVGCPFGDGLCITPAQARAATWHSLIAGARGIIYFQHSFSGPCTDHHVLRDNGCYQAMINTITSVDTQIRSIAPALNGPRLSSGFSASPNVRAVAKWDGQNFYIIAGSAENGGPFPSTFSLPCVGNATTTVLGENRTIPVSAGSFTDSFADGNAIHIYRIDGGSTCGLTLGDVDAALPLLWPSPLYGLHAIGRLIPGRPSPELSE